MDQQLTAGRPAEELVSFVAPASLEADQYRGLRHLLERVHHDSGRQVFGVTSAGSGDGKTVTTLNLAGSLAQSRDSRVLVIDADLHRPKVAAYLGLGVTSPPGLVEAILDERCGLDAAVRRVDALNVSVLLTGDHDANSYELLNSPRFASLIEQARQRFDYVVIDTPPLIPLPDCRLIGRSIDGFLMVVRADRTRRKDFVEALNLLDPARIIGVVFNGDERPISRDAAYYAYYRDHHNASPSSTRRGWWRRPFTERRIAR